MKQTAQKQHQVRVRLTASVRTRLTLWYLAVMAFIMVLFGGSLYATQTFLNVDTANNKLETQLYQDSQHFTPIYRQPHFNHQDLSTLQLNQSAQETPVLLAPAGSVLDARGHVTCT